MRERVGEKQGSRRLKVRLKCQTEVEVKYEGEKQLQGMWLAQLVRVLRSVGGDEVCGMTCVA